jgi:RNA polymerase II subunit A small phosphatase-like protein
LEVLTANLIKILVQTQLFKVFVTIRPGVEAFIDTLSEYFDIVLWTASLKEYADPVMDVIDPQRKAQTRLYRESCTPLKGGLAKNLNKLGRDLREVFIIDVITSFNYQNSSMSFMLQPENGFLIKDFIADKNDIELEIIMPFLIWLSQVIQLFYKVT